MGFLEFERLYRRHFGQPGKRSREEEEEDESLLPPDEREGCLPREWQEVLKENPMARRKFRIWEKTQGMCIYCGRGITVDDFINGVESDIEHILPQALGGGSYMDNLVCSCRTCNRAKGDLPALDYILTLAPREISDYFKRLRLLSAAGLISAKTYHMLTTPKCLLP